MKNEITWKELIKKISLEQQAKGTFDGLKGVFALAKKEWDKIKSGKHESFTVKDAQSASTTKTGKNKTVKNKTVKNKNVKKIKGKGKGDAAAAVRSVKNMMMMNKTRKVVLCDKCKLCDECKKRNGIVVEPGKV